MSGVFFEYQVDDSFIGVFHHQLAGQVAHGLSYSGEEQAQEVVHLGCGAYGASWIAVHRFLFDGYDRAKAGNLVHVGSFEAAEHVSCICREGLDVASLAFSEYGVESQRRLPAAAEPGHNSESAMGNVNVDVPEVVGSCTCHADAPAGAVVGYLRHRCAFFFIAAAAHRSVQSGLKVVVPAVRLDSDSARGMRTTYFLPVRLVSFLARIHGLASRSCA